MEITNDVVIDPKDKKPTRDIIPPVKITEPIPVATPDRSIIPPTQPTKHDADVQEPKG